MTSTHDAPAPQDDPLDAVIADYLQQVEAGAVPDREALLADHPELADRLRTFFADYDRIDRQAAGLRLSEDPERTIDRPEQAGDVPRMRDFGGYELLEVIARGGMGVVYKARNMRLNRVVALKMILAGPRATQRDVARFHAEAQAAASLDHPHIVPIYEVGEHEGRQYYAMRLIEGPSLACRPRGDLRDDVRLVATVARAVHFAHQRGVLHRDIKPSNILLDPAGTPYVTDFGLAKRLDVSSRGLTLSGDPVGTPRHMAPEQAAGRKDLTIAVDVYSLGVVLYERLTGVTPFAADDVLDLLRQVREADPPRPSSVRPGLDRDLETVCLKCLEKNPGKRYASAEALADDLDRWLRGEPIVARRVQTWERAVKWVRRRPAIAALLAVSVVAALTLLNVAWWYNRQLESTLVDARARLWQSLYEQARSERLIGNRRQALDLIAEAARMKTTPDLRHEAAEAFFTSGVRVLQEFPYLHDNYGFNSDGTRLVFDTASYVSNDNKVSERRIIVCEAGSGRRSIAITYRNEPDVEGFWGRRLAFSPSDHVLVTAEQTPRAKTVEGLIRFWDLNSGNELSRIQVPANQAELPPNGGLPFVFSPDGRHLAVAGIRGVVVYDARTRQQKTMLGPGIPVAFPSEDRVLIYSDKRLGAWDVTTGKSIFFTPEGLLPLDVSADGRAAVLGRFDPEHVPDVFTVWDLTKGREMMGDMPIFGGKVRWARFSSDGQRLAYYDESRPAAIRVWDVSAGGLPDLTGLLRGSLEFLDPSGSTFFSPDGSLVAAMAGRDVVAIWDVESGCRVAVLKDNQLPNLRFFEPQANFGWAALHDNQVRVWSRDGRLATIGRAESNNNRVVKLWEVMPGPVKYQLASAVDSLSVSDDGKRLAANDTIWDVEQGGRRTLLKPAPLGTEGRFAVFTRPGGLWTVGVKRAPHQTAFSRGRLADPPEPVRIRQLAPTTKELTVPNPHGVSCLDISRDGRLLSVCREDPKAKKGLIAIWDLAEGRQLAVWEPPVGASEEKDFQVARHFVRFGADGKRLVTCSNAGVEVWDVGSGQRFRMPKFVEEHAGVATYYTGAFPAALSPDGKLAFVGLYGTSKKGNEVSGVVGVADAETGSMIGIWKEHQGAVWSLAVSPDGKVLASGGAARVSGWSGGDDLMIRLWEVPTGRELARWQAHESGVTALAFSPDGRVLFSGGGDGELKVWDLAGLRDELARLGCN